MHFRWTIYANIHSERTFRPNSYLGNQTGSARCVEYVIPIHGPRTGSLQLLFRGRRPAEILILSKRCNLRPLEFHPFHLESGNCDSFLELRMFLIAAETSQVQLKLLKLIQKTTKSDQSYSFSVNKSFQLKSD